MIENKFNDKWKYWLDKDAFALVWNIPEEARELTLPHDAMLEKNTNSESSNKGNTGFRDGAVYNYVKMFEAKEEYKQKTLILKFEGVYMNAFVYINGELAAKSPFGYTTFYVHMNEYLKYGEINEIRVIVRNGAMTNSRWYSGGGIYRDVYLLMSDTTYIVPEGVGIATENISKDLAVINVSSEIKSRGYENSNLVIETIIKDENQKIVAKDLVPVVLFGNDERKVQRRISIDNPKLWSDKTPNLYTCISKLYREEELIDENISDFGIRTIQVDTKKGLRVNGETVKLRGACIHHDSGLLGAATIEDAQYRQVELLKAAGFNAIRMSHHPMAPSMLRACDKIGMLVMDETFDMWNRCKSDYDYGLYFNEWWEKDVTAMVRKDFNHPSVILYSIGNEIPEIGTNHGAKISYDICKKIKSLDNTRFTLASINGVFAAGDAVDKVVADVVSGLSSEEKIEGNVNDFMSIMDKHMDKIVVHEEITKKLDKACAYTDIAGYNYMAARYETDIKSFPNRVIVGSETYPPEIARNWELVERCNHVIGDFTWTGWDYIGEAGVGVPAYSFGEGGFGAKYPCQLAYCGDIDITGVRRPVSYFREIVLGLRSTPYIAVQNPYKYGEALIKTPWVLSDSVCSWTYEGCEGKPVVVEVYSAGDSVELLCNEKSLGKKTAGKEAGFRVLFDTVYTRGTLTAISYENEKEIGRMELNSAGSERSLVIKPEKLDNEELIYAAVEICDKNGIIAADNDMVISLKVEGGAYIAGFGSGDPKPEYNYNENITKTFNGRAMIILNKNGLSNEVRLEVACEGLETVVNVLTIA